MQGAGWTRRVPVTVAVGTVVLVLLIAGAATLVHRVAMPPNRAEAAGIVYGPLLANHVWDGVPHVLFRQGTAEGDRIYFDHLRRDLDAGLDPSARHPADAVLTRPR